jgi:hypothetical protein
VISGKSFPAKAAAPPNPIDGQPLTAFPWVPSSQAFGRRPYTRSIAPARPASETLHETSRSGDGKSVQQRVPLVWTRCHLGGRRPWFLCACGRRAAKLYQYGAPVFACRQCCGLAYRSQQEIPRHRAISRAQKLRMRLGGSANLLEPFPKKPRGMYRRTYYRLSARAMAAQERSIALDSDYLR